VLPFLQVGNLKLPVLQRIAEPLEQPLLLLLLRNVEEELDQTFLGTSPCTRTTSTSS
jgi:hypothetical protein